MTPRLPDWCAYGNHAHPAAYAVDGPRFEALTCQAHLGQATKRAGPQAQITPLPGHQPPPEQARLF